MPAFTHYLLVSPVVRLGTTAPARLARDPDTAPTPRTEWRFSTTSIPLVESLVPLLPASTLPSLPTPTLAYTVTSRDVVEGQPSTLEGHPEQALTTATTTVQATLGLEQPLVSPLVAAYLIFVGKSNYNSR